MTDREKYKAIGLLDETDKKIAALFVEMLNWVRVFRSVEVMGILQETRGRLQNSKGIITLSSAVDLQNEVLKERYNDWSDEEVAYALVEKQYMKKLKVDGKMRLENENQDNIEERLQILLNLRQHLQFDVEHWFKVHFSN
jgi:hypothetical protein